MLTSALHATPSEPSSAQRPPAGLPAAVFDETALQRLQELDPSGINRLLERVFAAFETSVRRLDPVLQAASSSGDLAGIRHVAHTLKSSSASIGALRLSHLCADVESLIRQDLPEQLPAPLGAMRAEIEVVLQALTKYTAPPTT